MPKGAGRWTLRDIVDFEAEIAEGRPATAETIARVREAACGRDDPAARRTGLRVWLDGIRETGTGAAFDSGCGAVGALLAAAAFLSGIGAVLGIRNPARGGVDVTLFVAVLIGGQWLLLSISAGAWLARRRAADGYSLVQSLIGKLARRFAGKSSDVWWKRMIGEGGQGRRALLWRLARMAQSAGIFFNLGVLGGLGGLVMLRHVGFYWETTTEEAMHALLGRVTGIVAAPWSAWLPGALPDAAVIAESRWVPGRGSGSGPAEWWRFLLMATLVWGLLPRLLLWVAAWMAERGALDALDFQARHHRALWRELTATGRDDAVDAPLDGVLVLDVGGSGFSESQLRPFLLRRMRVNPTAWHSVAVLDEGEEKAASEALRKAPAGLVFLTEGWALSPARMEALHAKARETAGPGLPIRFLVANPGNDGKPSAPTAEERREWERFTDGLRDPETDVVFYSEDGPAE